MTNYDVVCTFAAYILYVISGLGITAGAHRLWAHKSYKAKWPLKVILIIFNTVAFQVRYLSNYLLKNFNTSLSDRNKLIAMQ